MTEVTTVYFTQPGKDNTDAVLGIAKKRAEELGIKTILVASTSGDTGVKAVQLFKNQRVVVITHSMGLRAPNTLSLTEENKAKILESGGSLLICTHAFGGVGRAVRRKFNTYELDELIANVLRVFGQGMKVACEIALMAADAGLVRTDEETIAIAGTHAAADTAVVLQPANAQDFFDLRVKEILCKPRL